MASLTKYLYIRQESNILGGLNITKIVKFLLLITILWGLVAP